MSDTEDISALVNRVEREFKDDLARSLAEVNKPVERRLLDVASNDQLEALETIARESRERILGGARGLR